jgi:hypothetical protein
MSHVYSFSLFSVLLFGTKSFMLNKKIKYYLLSALVLALAVLIRPTNILFLFIVLMVDIKNLSQLADRIKLIFLSRNFFYAVLISSIIFLPQALYWKFAFGKYIVWSYEGEEFTYWNNPQFLPVWFSPQSGLFTYTPILILSLISSIVMIRRTIPNGILVVGTFIVVSYMCASWCNPFFGVCNFGKRPMVDYMPILMMPIAFLFQTINQFSKWTRRLLVSSLVLAVYYNLILFAEFNTCFFGSPWDWHTFGRLLLDAVKLIK